MHAGLHSMQASRQASIQRVGCLGSKCCLQASSPSSLLRFAAALCHPMLTLLHSSGPAAAPRSCPCSGDLHGHSGGDFYGAGRLALPAGACAATHLLDTGLLGARLLCRWGRGCGFWGRGGLGCWAMLGEGSERCGGQAGSRLEGSTCTASVQHPLCRPAAPLSLHYPRRPAHACPASPPCPSLPLPAPPRPTTLLLQ